MTHPLLRFRLIPAGVRLAASGLLALALGCVSDGVNTAYVDQDPAAIIEETPLGGEALAQRKQDLQRALGDVTAFHSTMASLIDRRDRSGLAVFDDFVAAYVDSHLDPLLRAEWQSSHPEVMATDANLRFVKADLMVLMRYPRRVQEVIDEIARRYQGRESMLVGYPLGEENSLGQALEMLEKRKWEG